MLIRRKSQPANKPITSPASGASGTSVVRLTMIPSANPMAAPTTSSNHVPTPPSSRPHKHVVKRPSTPIGRRSRGPDLDAKGVWQRVRSGRSQPEHRETVAFGRRAARGVAWALLGVVLFSFSVPLTTLAVERFDPFLTATGRAAIAG